MSIREFVARSLPFMLTFALLGGCAGGSDPQAALDAAVQQLQDNLEAKQTGAVLEQLHGEFTAQQVNDREWARRTMTLLFLRHKNVKVLALSKHSHIDPTYSEKGYTEAQVALTGAEGLIPDSARHFSVKLEWWQDDGEWKLARLEWD
ncbi:hypothetical protein [Phytopseudomonas dryadis]|uniref:Nuclear transport factor 2 family protein n=1 Tax=Phytopseudomonas dryadis TaxID=2487520 RepID=A0A4Q9R3F3_9GAMM|nr:MULTISPECIES: hypothetical protein [Pseudomonas]TBU92872.1 hypothetical protein DNK44_10875 [Pseudomonas dryadis]TBV04616.1 hypothetical protein DNK34_13785 [Pseudomonas dryadis]TBV17295.1 hypothetical protein DNK41_13295 [Pseudomonas sp. FRB 230]